MKQTTCHLLMIEPVAFHYNQETAENNHYQKKPSISEEEIQIRALQEFNEFVRTLRAQGIDITVAKDIKEQNTPDSIFPNNWVSFHANGTAVLYPMFAENRRKERRRDILEILKEKFRLENIIDLSPAEKDGRFLEGTGSIILDRDHRIAYAALSARTDLELFLEFCENYEYQPLHFTAYQTVDGERLPIYHTNVMMSVGTRLAVVCLECIDEESERDQLMQSLRSSGKEILEITEEQVEQYAGNMLEVSGKAGQCFQVMSSAAYRSLTEEQINTIEKYCTIIHSELGTIESNGGGSARCMMAEVFLERITDNR